MKLVNKWSPNVKFRKVDTTFCTDYTYEKELTYEITLAGNALHKADMEYHVKFGHNIALIQNIAIVITIDIYYTDYSIGTKKLAPNLPGFQYLKICIQYMASHLTYLCLSF